MPGALTVALLVGVFNPLENIEKRVQSFQVRVENIYRYPKPSPSFIIVTSSRQEPQEPLVALLFPVTMPGAPPFVASLLLVARPFALVASCGY